MHSVCFAVANMRDSVVNPIEVPLSMLERGVLTQLKLVRGSLVALRGDPKTLLLSRDDEEVVRLLNEMKFLFLGASHGQVFGMHFRRASACVQWLVATCSFALCVQLYFGKSLLFLAVLEIVSLRVGVNPWSLLVVSILERESGSIGLRDALDCLASVVDPGGSPPPMLVGVFCDDSLESYVREQAETVHSLSDVSEQVVALTTGLRVLTGSASLPSTVLSEGSLCALMRLV